MAGCRGVLRTVAGRRGVAVAVVLALAALSVLPGLLRAPALPPTGLTGGPVRAPGGPFLYDVEGRVLALHGVNAVDKVSPYELVPAPGRPWDLSTTDARRIAALGFDVVRLGVIWEGLAPGSGGPDQPAVCTPGPPGAPRPLDRRVVAAYLARLRRTVALLGRFHVYSIIDMHQDVYSSVFGGEGAPPWAVCTGGAPIVIPPGRWSKAYGTPAVRQAFTAFMTNSVVGDLQGAFDQAWAAVARGLAGERWVLGYDVLNEPLSLPPAGGAADRGVVDLLCLYTGSAHPGRLPGAAGPVTCPPGTPRTGAIPTIERADPHHLVFVEGDIAAPRSAPLGLGPMPFARLVAEYHAYCSWRSPVTGNPTDDRRCAAQAVRTVGRHAAGRAALASSRQRQGPPVVLGEFGATSDPWLVAQVAGAADAQLQSWLYWQWRGWGDPTGSTDEALVTPMGRTEPTVRALARPYAQAVAGRPLATGWDADRRTMALRYRPWPAVTAPTVVFVPRVAEPTGWCVSVRGGVAHSAPGSPLVDITNRPGAATVEVRVTPGRCVTW